MVLVVVFVVLVVVSVVLGVGLEQIEAVAKPLLAPMPENLLKVFASLWESWKVLESL